MLEYCCSIFRNIGDEVSQGPGYGPDETRHDSRALIYPQAACHGEVKNSHMYPVNRVRQNQNVVLGSVHKMRDSRPIISAKLHSTAENSTNEKLTERGPAGRLRQVL